MEMVLSGDYLQPTIFGEPYFNKPPLFNWVLATCFKLTGSFSEWAVRVPSILAFLLTGLFLFLLFRRTLGLRAAFLAALFFLTAADPLFYGTVNAGEIDLFLVLPVFFQVAALPLFFQRRQFLTMFLVSYTCMAVVFLTKHFAAFAFQAVALSALVVSTKNWRVLFGWQHLSGAAVFAALVGTYTYAYAQQYPVAPYFFNLLAETGEKSGADGIGERLIYMLGYPLVLLKLLFPWSLLVFLFIKKKSLQVFRRNPLPYFCLVFSVLSVGLYWLLPETRDRYLYPLFPFFCVVLALLFLDFSKIKLRHAIYIALVLAALRIAYNMFIMPLQKQRLTYRNHASEILKITEEQQVALVGWETVRHLDHKLFGRKIYEGELRTPPIIPYALPYYITKQTGKIIFYHPELKPGIFYLAPHDFMKNSPHDVFYQIPVPWIPNGLILCKIK